MFGGEHFNNNGVPTLVKPGIYRCTDCERTHCYAIRGEFLRKLYLRWIGGGPFNGLVHCDWIMGRDPEMQFQHKVYAPEKFIAGQERGTSDIDCGIKTRKFFNAPSPDLPVIHLHAPRSTLAALRHYGFHTGVEEDPVTDIDTELLCIFDETRDDMDSRVKRLSERISKLQWHVAADPFLICTIWHPEATPEIVKRASRGPVYEIKAEFPEEALAQLPIQLIRPARPLMATGVAYPFESPIPSYGWAAGFWSV
jgi:hypothetical protein